MTRRAPALPEPTAEERDAAREAAARMRQAIADPSTMGAPMLVHLDMSRPRRGVWIKTWANLPGLACIDGQYQHSCLPGWYYERAEIVPEMIPDLEALAERGERPTTVTNPTLKGTRR